MSKAEVIYQLLTVIGFVFLIGILWVNLRLHRVNMKWQERQDRTITSIMETQQKQLERELNRFKENV